MMYWSSKKFYTVLFVSTLTALLLYTERYMTNVNEFNKYLKKLKTLDSVSETKGKILKTTTSTAESTQSHLLDIEADKIDKLLEILHTKESRFEEALNALNIASFQKLVNNEPTLKRFSFETKKFLRLQDQRVHVTNEFVRYLKEKSEVNLNSPVRATNPKRAIKNEYDLPVIVTAANSDYFGPLQFTVFLVHKNYPEHKLIIYDLGLQKHQLELTKKNCKCEVKSFDPQRIYRKISNHVGQLKTYAWKPIIVQESLELYEKVFYIDSSVRLNHKEIGHVIESLNNLNIMANFIPLNLTCYTNPKMFDWFSLPVESYANVFTIDANILMFKRSFLTSLIMKAWVTCALDADCIAPPGSQLYKCCGCHRYDQDALTIITSYFFIHPSRPVNSILNKYPAFAFYQNEQFFFKVNRGESMNYFT